MGRYIDWSDVVARYSSISDIGGAIEVDSVFISYAEYELDGQLATHFTVPFSNNNETVKDICIDKVYINAGKLKIEEADSLRSIIETKIKELKSGDRLMIIDGSSYTAQLPDGGEAIYTNTGKYFPVFGMSPPELSQVDSEWIYDEEQERGY